MRPSPHEKHVITEADEKELQACVNYKADRRQQ
ncbi:hypothetical protein R6138_00845 [Ralstonia thomasii]|jgi:hypothetical protein|uniref:Transposase n=1 Tax=Ralstonia thomasii TaxID=3058596 RepID=A0ABM9IZ09_9RALS|nr:hypothetical protein LMG18095_00238 [Ralstonia sp. LMG 18095]CAJ0861711.1 hypothetical protein R6138_00845 [Ralstonia sp. LMG 18095]